MNRFAPAFALLALYASVTFGAMRQCPPEASDEYFFPAGLLEEGGDAFKRHRYSEQLRAMGQRSLSCGVLNVDAAYRFTWLRSFHHPISIRITRSKDSMFIDAVELDGAGGYRPGKVLRHSSRRLFPTEWEEARSRFESLSMVRQDPKEIGLDGAEWVFERRQPNNYAAVSLWTPETGPAQDLGLLMLRLVAWEPSREALY